MKGLDKFNFSTRRGPNAKYVNSVLETYTRISTIGRATGLAHAGLKPTRARAQITQNFFPSVDGAIDPTSRPGFLIRLIVEYLDQEYKYLAVARSRIVFGSHRSTTTSHSTTGTHLLLAISTISPQSFQSLLKHNAFQYVRFGIAASACYRQS